MNYQFSKKSLFFYWAILLGFTFLGGYIGVGIRYIDWSYTGPSFSLMENIAYLLLQILFGAILIYAVHFKAKKKLTLWVLIGVLALFAITMVSVFTMGSEVPYTDWKGNDAIFYTDSDTLYTLPGNIVGKGITVYPHLRLNEIIQNISMCFMIFVLLEVAPKLNRGEASYDFLFYFGILFGLICILLTFVPKNEWAGFFTKGYARVSSYTGQKNNFGYVLIVSSVCTALLSLRQKKWLYGLLMIGFFFFTIMSGCKIAWVVNGLMTFGYFIWALVYGIKSKKASAIIASSIMLLVFLLFAGVVFLGKYLPEGNKIHAFSSKIWENLDHSEGTWKARARFWEKMWPIISGNPMYLLFGMGELSGHFYMGVDLYQGINNSWYLPHSSTFELMLEGGVLRVLMEDAFIIYLLYLDVRAFIRKDRMALGWLCFILAYFARGLVEVNPWLDGNFESAVGLLYFIVPMFTQVECLKEKKEVLPMEEKKPVYEKKGTRRTANNVILYLMPGIVFASLICSCYFNNYLFVLYIGGAGLFLSLMVLFALDMAGVEKLDWKVVLAEYGLFLFTYGVALLMMLLVKEDYLNYYLAPCFISFFLPYSVYYFFPSFFLGEKEFDKEFAFLEIAMDWLEDSYHKGLEKGFRF